MNNEKVGCITLVEKGLHEMGEGREVARKDLLIKVAELMRKEGISEYKITEIDIDDNDGFEFTEKVEEDELGKFFIQ